MGNMAQEMNARIEQDGGAGLVDGGAAAPGTGRVEDPGPAAPAAALNTDTTQVTDPGPVPYSRFKEVNDQLADLRGYDTLRQYGWDPDSLGRLATFEAAYVEDPHGTVANMVDNLDLPDEAKEAIKEQLGASAPDASAGGGNQPTPDAATTPDEPPPWAKPLVQDYQSRQEQRVAEERSQMLDAVLGHWNELDEKAGVVTPESIKLSLIATHASSAQYKTPEQLAEGARQDALHFREAVLGSAVVPGGNRNGPLAVPRSAATPAPPQSFGGDIKAATKAAEAAIQRGELGG